LPVADALLSPATPTRTRTPLERVSTAQHVAESLRERLLRGEFAPGSRIPEEDIAADLQVSRNSVREALQILASEGLVLRSLHRGGVVSDLDREQLADVYQARRVIEIASLRTGMGRPELWLDGVLEALRAMESAVAAADLPGLLDADRRFHEGIVAASGSQRIQRFYHNLQMEIRLTRTWRGEREPSPVFFARHKEVVEAIQAHEARQAERLLRRIIDDGESRVRTSLEGPAAT
jgi:DNA-binding GntR family transcriptional regulator